MMDRMPPHNQPTREHTNDAIANPLVPVAVAPE